MQGDDGFLLLSESKNESDDNGQDRLFDWSVEPSTPYRNEHPQEGVSEDRIVEYLQRVPPNVRERIACLSNTFGDPFTSIPMGAVSLSKAVIAEMQRRQQIDDFSSEGVEPTVSESTQHKIQLASLVWFAVTLYPGLLYFTNRVVRARAGEQLLQPAQQSKWENLYFTGLVVNIPIIMSTSLDRVLREMLRELGGFTPNTAYLYGKIGGGVTILLTGAYFIFMTSDGKYNDPVILRSNLWMLGMLLAQLYVCSFSLAYNASFEGQTLIDTAQSEETTWLGWAWEAFRVFVLVTSKWDSMQFNALNTFRLLGNAINSINPLRIANLLLGSVFRAQGSVLCLLSLREIIYDPQEHPHIDMCVIAVSTLPCLFTAYQQFFLGYPQLEYERRTQEDIELQERGIVEVKEDSDEDDSDQEDDFDNQSESGVGLLSGNPSSQFSNKGSSPRQRISADPADTIDQGWSCGGRSCVIL